MKIVYVQLFYANERLVELLNLDKTDVKSRWFLAGPLGVSYIFKRVSNCSKFHLNISYVLVLASNYSLF